jgi:uncharacterized membrane protein
VEDLIPLISRWVHVGTSIVLVGGTVFMRLVLAPAASATLSDAEHAALRERIIGTWKRFVHIGILLFLLTGFYNYLVVAVPKHENDSLYHALMGTKILLALVVFFVASALVGKSQGLQKIRDKRSTWLLVLIVLSALIVGIAGFLKIRTWEPKRETQSPEASAFLLSTEHQASGGRKPPGHSDSRKRSLHTHDQGADASRSPVLWDVPRKLL